MRSAVVFPQPDGPSSTMNSPSRISRSSASTATTSSNRFVTPSKVRLATSSLPGSAPSPPVARRLGSVGVPNLAPASTGGGHGDAGVTGAGAAPSRQPAAGAGRPSVMMRVMSLPPSARSDAGSPPLARRAPAPAAGPPDVPHREHYDR